MKRGISEEKVMGPMFPRLHVNDTEKGGPRAPPRNKMALYEQLSIPSQRYNPSDLPVNNSNSATLVHPHSSQENEPERDAIFPRQLPVLRHPVEKPHDRSTGSNTPSREGTLKRTDQLLQFKPRENLVNSFGESQKTDIVQLEFASDSQVDCTVFTGSVIDADNDSQEDKTCKSSQTREMNQSDELSETSMVEFVAEMNISPDDVVRMIGEKHFWKARRAIADQQRALAVQVFELHRLLKVQKLIAGSPNVNLEDTAYLGKPLKKLSANRRSVKAPENVPRTKNDSDKPESRMECNAENDVGKTCSSVQNSSQPSSCRPVSEKQRPTPVKYDSLTSPWCYNQPPGHQWLIPVMSPSEGLVYKPHPGPSVISSVYGGCGPAYGLPFAPPTGHDYFRPFGMPVMNPAIPSPDQYQSNQVAATRSQGQLSGRGANINIQHQNSSNIGSEYDGAVPEVVRLYPSRDSELHASTASSPSQRARGVNASNSTRGRSAFRLFPTSPAIDNSVLRPQPRFPNHPARVIKVVPHNARSATESAARIFQSIQEERKQ
ncbi:putative clathrin interactor EPSIN 1-like [Capsicum annuum]|uniref:protein EARLY FLOWERING 3 n=1 Tax=Capsicum annuum TaxID=4072 RepID=UPI001FB121BD|nr:protein EARLY FLOWERING 3 [Capsicum annuum]KAF3632865.1 putative clathrin interactor EPSIN 1-like [Capsicum annuum]KAF3659862.1 putative clathrin interactor EPSIN 1-like [Capsicum annuum]